MAQADKYPFLMFSVAQQVTLTGATTALVTLATAPTGIPSTTLRVFNAGTAVALGAVALMMGTATACTISNGMWIPAQQPAQVFSLGGQTVIQLVSQATTGTVNIAAGQGSA